MLPPSCLWAVYAPETRDIYCIQIYAYDEIDQRRLVLYVGGQCRHIYIYSIHMECCMCYCKGFRKVVTEGLPFHKPFALKPFYIVRGEKPITVLFSIRSLERLGGGQILSRCVRLTRGRVPNRLRDKILNWMGCPSSSFTQTQVSLEIVNLFPARKQSMAEHVFKRCWGKNNIVVLQHLGFYSWAKIGEKIRRRSAGAPCHTKWTRTIGSRLNFQSLCFPNTPWDCHVCLH